eukprot:1157718-Pelagomonas_calceolata.AAC.8
MPGCASRPPSTKERTAQTGRQHSIPGLEGMFEDVVCTHLAGARAPAYKALFRAQGLTATCHEF